MISKNSITKKQTNGIILFIAFLLFSYCSIKAFFLSITWDEAFSYLQYVRHGIVIPEKFEQMDANNHILLTWLNIILINFLGVNEFVLRIPSLVGHLLFLFFSFKLVQHFQKPGLLIASFLILNLNPYILDFFSLSRGYGLSLGLMISSIYFLQSYIVKGYRNKDAILACLMGALATTANFAVLNYYLVSAGIILMFSGYHTFQKSGKKSEKFRQFFKSSGIPISIIALALLFFIPIAFKLKEAGALFYGGNIGFWTDTIGTITIRSFYDINYPYWFQLLAKGLIILTICTSAVLLGSKLAIRQNTPYNLFLGSLFLLLILSSLSTIVQHYFLGTLFMIDRTAMFLVVLFNLLFVFLVNELSKQNNRSVLITYGISLFAVFHFILSFNLTYVLEWKSNADVKQMISDLEKVKDIPPGKSNISICIPLSFNQSINYYRAIHDLSWINYVDRSDNVDFQYDYLYLEPDHCKDLNFDSLIILKTYLVSKSILAKPKYPVQFSKLKISRNIDFENTSDSHFIIDENNEYGPSLNYFLNDSILPLKKAEIVFTSRILATKISKCNLYLVVAFENKQGVYLWRRAFIQDYIKKENEWVDICFTCVVPQEAKIGDKLATYIWNPNKHNLSIKKMDLIWKSN